MLCLESAISILSIGCGDESYVVGRPKVLRGGLFAWRDIIHAAMRLQSQNALGQAGLLIGADRVVRVVAPELNHQINLDDWSRASQELPEAASTALIEKGNTVAAMFLSELAVPYKSVVGVASRNVVIVYGSSRTDREYTEAAIAVALPVVAFLRRPEQFSPVRIRPLSRRPDPRVPRARRSGACFPCGP